MIDFCKKNIRYITAGVLFVVLVIVLAQCTNPKDKKDAQNVIETEQTEVSDTAAQEYEVDANPAINELINNYYTAYANGDIATGGTAEMPRCGCFRRCSLFSNYSMKRIQVATRTYCLFVSERYGEPLPCACFPSQLVISRSVSSVGRG